MRLARCPGGFVRTFAQRSAQRLQSPIRPDAWWATDYHLDWLLGALVWHIETDNTDRHRPRPNDEQLIRGNQEDIDLIIASGSDVILLKAKGHDAWMNFQLTSKIKRLDLLCDGTTGLVKPKFSSKSVTLHLVLMSIREPYKVDCDEWPAWARKDDGPYWMRLDADSDHIRTGRCDMNGSADANGSHWRFLRLSQNAILPSA
jgi:hypothetical protein